LICFGEFSADAPVLGEQDGSNSAFLLEYLR
jgi:hypothetical protein